MRRATVTQAKNGLSALLAQVKAGETIEITDRGIPVARLEPVAPLGDDDEARLARLERAGLIRRGTGEIPREILADRGPKLPPDVSGVDIVIEERRAGR
jgi:prevent-host-death family protein